MIFIIPVPPTAGSLRSIGVFKLLFLNHVVSSGNIRLFDRFWRKTFAKMFNFLPELQLEILILIDICQKSNIAQPLASFFW